MFTGADVVRKTDIRIDIRSLDRRLKFEGDARYFINRLVSKAQAFGPIAGKWSATILMLIVRSSIVVFDLFESIRSKGNTFSIGEPRRAIIHTSEQLCQHPRFRGYWYDAVRHSAVGMHLGVDLIKHKGRFYINELNLNAAMRPQRRSLYDEDVDPILTGIFSAAQAQRFRRVVLCSGRWRKSYREEAERAGRRHGLEVVLASTHNWQDPDSLHMPGLPVPLEENTLYVIFAGRHTPMDYLIHDKLGSATWLPHLAGDQPDDDQLVSGIRTSEKLIVPPTDAADPWPNLVIKLAGLDKGSGVLFAKFRDDNEARTTLGLERDGQIPKALRRSLLERLMTRFLRQGPVLYQAYIPSDKTETKRIQTYRLHLLVSPPVNSFLSVHGIVSSTEIPESLPIGTVTDPSPYITSFAQGAHYATVDQQTVEQIRRAATQIGAALKTTLTQKFKTDPG